MEAMVELYNRIVREEDGQGLIEYALIGALVAVALVLGLQALAGTGGIGGTFTEITSKLPDAST